MVGNGWSLFPEVLVDTSGDSGGYPYSNNVVGANPTHGRERFPMGTGGGGRQQRRQQEARGKRYRHLEMLGFENMEDEEVGGWKTCKSFREVDLAPHKKVLQYVFLCGRKGRQAWIVIGGYR